jgi:hypothetical protein
VQAPTLAVGEPESTPLGQLAFEDPVLPPEILDDDLLLSVHPSGDREKQELDEGGLHPAEDT